MPEERRLGLGRNLLSNLWRHTALKATRNGVYVGVNPDLPGSAATTRLLADDNVVVMFNQRLGGDSLTTTIAHEGRHVADDRTWAATHSLGGIVLGAGPGGVFDISHRTLEQRAWYVSSYIAEALGMRRFGPPGGGSAMQVWNAGWKAADRETLRSDEHLELHGVS